MRGRGPGVLLHRLGCGITPAYAGKSIWPGCYWYQPGDHPRVCGEESQKKLLSAPVSGSPPRMRGRAAAFSVPELVTGITPAYAGKSRCRLAKAQGYGDHPRVCGEELGSYKPQYGVWGSPPRMRGRVVRLLSVLCWIRITPAYAGKRKAKPTMSLSKKDHPRVCGEEPHLHSGCGYPPGSPPRMRGRAPLASCRCWGLRITPAYAGKSQNASNVEKLIGDHPRVCGEEPLNFSVRLGQEGSPPRMRGRGVGKLVVGGNYGITPAYAGKRTRKTAPWTISRDHPRVCGEESFGCSCCVPSMGSPPRMRGRVVVGLAAFLASGITPAYAGKRLNGSLL